MKTMSRKSVALLTAFLFMFALIRPVFATTIHSNIELSPTNTDGFSEIAAQAAVISFFQERSAYLQGKLDDLTSCNIPTFEDETTHLALLCSKEITYVFSSINISAFHFDTNHAVATVLESVTYLHGNETKSETVTHSVDIYPDENQKPIIASDSYAESFSGFQSCSYVPPEYYQSAGLMAAGSRHCLVYTAAKEIGYTESGTNITKYGSWFGQQAEWCAIFVSWCAYQSNISESIIPKTAWAPSMKSAGTYFVSQSQGGSTTPRAGDLFFEGSSSSNISHVGIVQSVNGNYISVIDGNCENKVNSHTLALSSSKVVGYARPNYAATNHSNVWKYNASHHWTECSNCAKTNTSKTTHNFGLSGGYYVCSTCGYRTSSVIEPTVTTTSRLDLLL